jgi:hypothetical protein
MYGYATPFWRHFHVLFDVRVLDLNLSNNWRRRPLYIRELKHVGRQHHDGDGQNKFLQINYSKETLSYIIIRMKLIQYKKLKTLALCLGRVLLNRILSCTCYNLKCRRCIKDVKICVLPLSTERRPRLKLPRDFNYLFIFIESLYWLPSSCCRPTCLSSLIISNRAASSVNQCPQASHAATWIVVARFRHRH